MSITFTPAPNALLTWDEYQAIMQNVGASEQNQITHLINVASTLCEDLCARKLAAQDITAVLSNPTDYALTSLVLSEYPVNSIASINIDPTSQFLTGTIVPSTEYSFNAINGVMYFNGISIPSGLQIAKVVYNAGYTTPPATLKQAVIETVMWLKRRIVMRAGGERGSNMDGLNTTFEVTLPQTIQQMLAPYKRIA
jgi:hypothetical protein